MNIFNFSKKNRDKQITATVEQITDEQLYKDVYSAQDEILKEANNILSSTTIDHEEYDRLIKLSDLGFIQAEAVVKIRDLKSKIEKSEETKKLLDSYSLIYPTNRFITPYCVDKICDKYNLILGPVSSYIAEVPEKNQNEILNFKFRRVDYRLDDLFNHRSLFGRSSQKEMRIRTGQWYPEYRHEIPMVEASMEEAKNNPWIPGLDLLIIAPAKKFNTRGMEISDYKLKRTELKDPIVLQSVIGGYLIVSSWGLEASDPMIVNAKHN